jgi:hypothetical protein
MITQPDVEGLIRRTRQYEFADGLRDLQLAVLMALMGFVAWLAFQPIWMTFVVRTAQAIGRWAVLVSMLPMLAAVLVVWALLGLMKWLRRRWLWRDSGMVQPSRWMVSRRINVLSAVIFAATFGVAFGLWWLKVIDDALVLRLFWCATGWSFGYTLIAFGRDLGLGRYVTVGALGAVLSAALLVLPLTFSEAALAFGLSWALVLGVSGFLTLRHAALGERSST